MLCFRCLRDIQMEVFSGQIFRSEERRNINTDREIIYLGRGRLMFMRHSIKVKRRNRDIMQVLSIEGNHESKESDCQVVTESSERAGRGIRKEENREEERFHSGNKLEIYHVFCIYFISKLCSVLLFQGYISCLAFPESSCVTSREKCRAGNEYKELPPSSIEGRLD